MRRWGLLAKEALSQTLTFARFFCLFHVTNHYLWSPTLVFGPSMLPTLNLTGDVILAEYVSHRVGRVGPGDIVFVRSPVDPNKIVTKRIVGVEGDRVTYFKPRNGDTCHTVVVPKGHVWIQGDNLYASRDSRQFGPVPYGLIEGKAFFRYFHPLLYLLVTEVQLKPDMGLGRRSFSHGLNWLE
ncbi:hypothetical protein CICLE_v10022477mg [Citrus x clementina]|uniref:Peptidase S26 domain-containing protein n=1 Tax=Citrus clementina TaxID=85681 RepID=V4TUV8_CITCL|nr:hypothetical protein CICLE_v10022477mg [Citrus x clementina]